MKNEFIELDRRFRKYDKEYRNIDDHLWVDWNIDSGLRWNELLERKRTVIVGRGGSGKTAETRNQARVLANNGKFAFWSSVSELSVADETISKDTLEDFTKCKIDDWMASKEPAFIFLDSVDEAKLTDPRQFIIALRKLKSLIKNALERVHLFVTTRLSAWQDEDLDNLENLLGLNAVNPSSTKENVAFPDSMISAENKKAMRDYKAFVCNLLPLNEKQQKVLAKKIVKSKSDKFLNLLKSSNYTYRALFPLDLMNLAYYWPERGKLGPWIEVVRDNIKKKLQEIEPVRKKHDSLEMDVKLRIAERLSFASVALRREFFSKGHLPNNDECKSITDLFMDLSPNRWEEYLILNLFKHDSRRNVGIEIRSEKEFLASEWLKKQELSSKELESICFSDKYGGIVVREDIAPIIGWISRWSTEVYANLLKRAPEYLLELGEPQDRPPDQKEEILRAFVDYARANTWYRPSIDIKYLRFFGEGKLGGIVKNIYKENISLPEVKLQMLRIITEAKIAGCEDICIDVALEESEPERNRQFAVEYLEDHIDQATEDNLRKYLLDNADNLSNRLCGSILEVIFKYDEDIVFLINYLASIDRPENLQSTYRMLRIFENACITNTQKDKSELLLGTILSHLDQSDKITNRGSIEPRNSWLLGYGAIHCDKVLDENKLEDHQERKNLLRFMIYYYIAEPYSSRDYSPINPTLFKKPVENASLRCDLTLGVLRESAFSDTRSTYEALDIWEKLKTENCVTDLDIFTEMYRKEEDDSVRSLTLKLMLLIADQIEVIDELNNDILEAINHDEKLSKFLANITESKKSPRKALDNIDDYNQKDELKEEEKERKWWQGISQDSSLLKWGGDSSYDNVAHIYQTWVIQHESGNPKEYLDSIDKISEWIGKDSYKEFINFLHCHWRSALDGSSQCHSPEMVLDALYLEILEDESGHLELKKSQAKAIMELAVSRVRNYEGVIAHLISKYPEIVDEFIETEISEQLVASKGYAQILFQLADVSEEISSRYIDTILDVHLNNDDLSYEVTENSLNILLIHKGKCDQQLSELLLRKLHANSSQWRYLWLAALMHIDARTGIEILQEDLGKKASADERTDVMISFLTALYDDIHRASRFSCKSSDFLRFDNLKALIILVYKNLRVEDDEIHDGGYTPNERDRAEYGRSWLFNKLFYDRSLEAYKTLQSLVSDYSHMFNGKITEQLLRNYRESHSSYEHWSEENIFALEKKRRNIIKSSQELYEVVKSHLNDIKYENEQGDFSLKSLLQKSKVERDFRLFISKELKDRGKGIYIVAPEEELSNRKKPDIRIHSIHGPGPTSIEIKVADSWSFNELIHAMKDQLVHRYMQDVDSEYGILLLIRTGHSNRTWEEGESSYKYNELVDRLNEIGNEIDLEAIRAKEICVVGIDVSIKQY